MKDCLFCKIIKGEIPTEFLYQDENVVAFHDLHPKAPVHILIVPKKHIDKLQDISDNDKELLGQLLLAAKKIAGQEKIGEGFKIVINCGQKGGQEIFHLHVHLLGGWEGGVD
ncbi:histidine triad nucleotide-binding protein [Candidatus Woesebacteria bacterium CG_4_10_14_0_2_um_filter_39_14]|uniref:Histidine triad nucleotide-binding protein n=3 Tax=Microgenomates group TaxID=1794810 RepID=A0A2M6YP92_9BACT|nr:MAG: histidine triad nucleotide-binding protein [Candidatus Shapirobacteria bacterium CG07_land_8_20_14_0_80_39_12]PIZ49817.1 MAG: histidine triad nucleotide-binding protein [Candidatus Woesebacteria bacterium CG_4_10_14_0_2_um_filter_39_14]PJA50098.1 MAG: histidine triad nucleotide-binding protein [Candidatus Shapirobacteria bacterium CG_4_9_14_3_um_filter_39_13]